MARENKNWAKAKFTSVLKKRMISSGPNSKSEGIRKKGFRNLSAKKK